MKNIYACLITLIFCLSFNADFSSGADIPWQMFCHDMKHTCRSPYFGPNGSAIKIRWSYKTAGAIYSSPAIAADGTIYFGTEDLGSSNGNVYAINPDGTFKWSYDTTGEVHSSPAIGLNGTIYIGADNAQFYAFKANGTTAFKKLMGGAISSSPVIDPDGNIYVGCDDNKLWSFADDGTVRWAYTTGDDIVSSPAVGSDGIIYFGSKDGKVYALYLDGSLKWSFDTGDEIISTPSIGPTYVIYIGIGNVDNYLLALNPDGTERWRFEAGSYITSCPGIGSDGTIYFGCLDGYIYAVNPDGTQRWTHSVASAMHSSPAIGADGAIHFGTYNGYLYAVDSDGAYKFKLSFGDEVYASPAIAPDGTMYVCTRDRFIYAIEGDEVPTLTPTKTPTITATPSMTPTITVTPGDDTDPPTVSIISPSNGATVSGIVDIRIKADDESGILSTEVQLNDGPWNDCTVGTTDSYWHFNWDTLHYSGQSVTIKARATDASTNFNVGVSAKVIVSVLYTAPGVEIMSNEESYTVGDMIEIAVRVDNPSLDTVDLYAALLAGTTLLWYPMWNDIPYPTVVDEEIWFETIASFTCVPEIPPGNYSFYAAITQNRTYEVIDIDSVTIRIE
ncbi:PQQ-binding-like beta-propeller repeat protein [bacterium]|nr:PQQ-binding-like beta-propeller repeat protein [bacterium]